MMANTEQVRRRNLTVQGLAAALSVGIAALGIVAADPRTQVFYVGVGAPLLLTALVGIARLAMARDPTRVAAVAIQHNWIVLSVALAFLALLPADFFLTATETRGVAGVVGAFLIVLSAVLLLDTRKRTGVDLSI